MSPGAGILAVELACGTTHCSVWETICTIATGVTRVIGRAGMEFRLMEPEAAAGYYLHHARLSRGWLGASNLLR